MSIGAGRRRPLLADVAARAGVSTASVSLVLRGAPGPSEQTRRRVLEVAAELGYRTDRTASSLARRHSGLLGVMIDIHDPFHAELVEHLDGSARDAGFDVVLSTTTRRRSERRAVETLLDFRCEAIVLLGSELPAAGIADLAQEVPLVVVGRRLNPLVADAVRAADEIGVAEAVEHLVRLGHRDIVHVDGGRGTIPADRRRGYRAGMRRAGLAARIRVVSGDHTEAGGLRAAAELMAGPAGSVLPTAVIAFNDPCAIGLIDALTKAGIAVPEAVSVVGYDDTPQAQWAHVNLTTVSQAGAEQAAHAVRMVERRLADPGLPFRELVLEPRLIERGTSGRAARD